MQPDKFKYYLRKSNGTNYDWYYVDTSGAIAFTASGTPVNALQYAPNGWTDKEPIWKRGMEYHAIFTTYAQPLKFIRDGRLIMRNEHYTNGSEAELEIYIEALDESDYTYSLYYYGEFDFSTFRDYEDDCECNIRDGGFLTKFNSRAGNPYEFPLAENTNVKYVKIDGGPPLWCYMEFTGIEQPADATGTPLFGFADAINLPTLLAFNTKGYSNGDMFNKGNEYIGPNSGLYAQPIIGSFVISLGMADKYFIRNTSNTETYDVRIKGTLRIATIADSGSSTRCRVRILRAVYGSGTILQDLAIADGIIYSAGTNGTEDIDFDDVLTLAPNECLWFQFFYTNNTSMVHKYHIYGLNIEASFQNFVNDAYVPFIDLETAFDQIIDKIGDSTTTVDTAYITTNYPRVCITSGDGLRNLSKSQIKYTFDELFKSVDYNLKTCLQYNRTTDELAVNSKDLAYDSSTQIVDFGDVAMFETAPFTDEMHSQLKIGYPDNTYDDVNGKEEFNNTLVLASPMTKTNNTKDMVCPFLSDMFGIILTIANLTNKTAADSEFDNDVFFLDIDTSAPAGTFDLNGVTTDYYELYRDTINLTPGPSYFELDKLFLDVNGTYSNQDKLFNLFFSPKRMLIRNANYITSIMYFVNSGIYDFVTSGKNTSGNERLITTYGSPVVTIDEGSDVNISDLGAPDDSLYMPLKAKIKCKIPVNLIEIMQTNPYGFCAWRWLGNTYYGYFLQASQKVAEYQEGEVELIFKADSDLSTLIV